MHVYNVYQSGKVHQEPEMYNNTYSSGSRKDGWRKMTEIVFYSLFWIDWEIPSLELIA